MALTDAQRRANNKYIAKSMTVLGCKVRKEYAEKVRAKCKEDGTTVNAILKRALDEYMLAGAIKEAGKAFLEEQGELLDKEGEG